MQVLTPDEVVAPEGMAVTIGTFDGVHLGHRRLLAILAERADALGVPAAVVTFDRHPATVVRPESAPLLLNGPVQKLELLESCGVDVTVVVPFDAQRADESAEDFVDEVLVGACRARVIVVGADFHFGRGRGGDVPLLRKLGAVRGFDVVAVDLEADGAPGGPGPVSATRIRRLVAAGDVRAAAGLLDRPHELRGVVVHGDGRGAALGVPTANLELPSDLALPQVGIYAGVCRRADGSEHASAISVGLRPTFAASAQGIPAVPLVEAHLIDFSGDLYDERIALRFVERLRDEQRFAHVDELISQMHADIEAARTIVGGQTC